MTKMVPKKIIAKLSILTALMLTLSTRAQAIEIDGIHFDNSHPVGQLELSLTGVAVLRWALLFDVYAGAFYLPQGVSGKEWTGDLPKRLELYYFRDFSANDFSSSSDKLLRESLGAAEYQSLANRLLAFYQLFRDIKTGDRYSLTYRPETGTELRLNDELLGSAPGADFAIAYFGIWLGAQPINDGFRDRILGIKS